MSASTQAAPRQISFGRFPTTLAALALVVILAVAVAIVALNGSKAGAPATTGSHGYAAPVVYDHSYSSGEQMVTPKLIPSYGGFGGPRMGESTPRVGDSTAAAEKARRIGGNNGPGLRPQ